MNATLRETRSQDISLNALLDGIETGQVVLPNFQRDFDWSDADVRSLLGTVLSGWPIGSLLLIEGDAHDEFYSPRPVESAPPVSSSIIYIILDGQQRLTSLYQALTGRGSQRYAMRVNRASDFSDVDVLDESIVSFSVDHDISSQQGVDDDLVIPVTALRDASSFFEWRDENVSDPDLSKWVTGLYREHLASLHQYRIPAVIVDSRIEPAAVARVFERVNRTGMKLGAFDLMVAKSYRDGFNLRTAWELSQAEYPILERMLSGDGLPVLTAMALHRSGDVRQAAVLRLDRAVIADEWDAAVKHFASAAHFVERKFGVLDGDWVPYKQMLIVLAALDRKIDLRESEADISTWFWVTGFGRRYDAASNTRAVNDYGALLRGEFVRSVLIMDRSDCLEATRGQQGAWHRAFLCAMAASAPQGEVAEPTGVQVRSVFARGTGSLRPPLHLRTLTFSLWRERTHIETSLGAPIDLEPSVPALEAQLKSLVRFISARAQVPVVLAEVEGGERR